MYMYTHYLSTLLLCVIVHLHVLMRDENERIKKEASKVKQTTRQFKATQHTQGSTSLFLRKMKGTKVQTLGARAVAGAWCMAGCLGHNYYYGHRCNY